MMSIGMIELPKTPPSTPPGDELQEMLNDAFDEAATVRADEIVVDGVSVRAVRPDQMEACFKRLLRTWGKGEVDTKRMFYGAGRPELPRDCGFAFYHIPYGDDEWVYRVADLRAAQGDNGE